jgi:twitching motility two-component system response regulator PilG
MFETMVSHSQWIRHAVAAAKAGNPSVAKIQLQKAAEADPDNPAIWLWMGWLADSPANAAHCLEIARSDARFEKIAVAGIEFSKALADFQLDQFSEASDQTAENADHDSAPEAASQKHQVKGPVEAVEDVVAAVESLQKEDVSELPADDVVDEISDVSTDDAPLEDEVQTVDDVQAVDFEEIEPAASQPTESSVDVEAAAPAAAEIETADVEVELMRSANELWQIAAEIVAETSSASEEDSQEQSLDQELWQPAVDEAGDDVLSVSSPEVATESEPKTVTVPEAIIDESEDDFAFSDDDSTDAEFEAAVLPEHDKVEPSPINVSVNPSLNLGDQWLGQDPVESPNAPVWRKAQSDWFSVDGSSEPEPAPLSKDLAAPPANPAVPLEENVPDFSEPQPAPIFSQPALPRVTASDVWQTAAIEKSTFAKAVAPQPANVRSVPASEEFFEAEPQIEHAANSGPATATSLDRKTVLVVDDSPTVRKLVALTLEKRGYKVVSAFDGVAAIKEIAAHNPSLILMDVNMPRLDGYQLCKLVKKHETTREIPVLMLTGKDGMFDRLRGRLVGCVGSIAKPFSPEELLEVVEQNILQVRS